MADLNYIESGYFTPENGYYVYTADAAATPTATTTLSATVGVIKQNSIALNASFTVAATISHIEGADLFAFSEAALAAAVTALRDNNVAASATFNIATDFVRTRTVSSDEAAVFSFTVTTVRSRDFASSQSAAFSLAADVTVIAAATDVEATLSSSFTQITLADRFAEVASAQSTSTTLTAAIDGTLEAAGALTSAATLTATISHIEGADLAAFSNAALTAGVSRTRDITSTIESFVSVTALGNLTADTASTVNSEFTQTVNESRIRDSASNASSSVDVIAIVNSNRYADVTLNATATVAATISHIHGADLTAFSNAALSANVEYIRSVAADLTAETTQSTTVETFIGVISNISSTASLRGNITGSQFFNASLSSISSIQLVAERYRIQFRSALGSNRFVSTGSAGAGIAGDLLDKTTYKFGTGSLYIPFDTAPVNKGIITSPNPSSGYWNIESNLNSGASNNHDFEITYWIKFSAIPTSESIIMWAGDTVGSGNGWGVTSWGNFTAYRSGAGVSTTLTTSGVTWTDWNHFRIQGYFFNDVSTNRRRIRIFRNGVNVGEFNNATYISDLTPDVSRFKIQAHIQRDYWIDDIRYSYGTGSTSEVDVPTGILGSQGATTKLLLNFDGRNYNDILGTQQGFTANAALTSYAVLNANGGKRLSTNANVNAAFTVDANVDRVRFVEFTADLESQASIATINNKLVASSAAITSTSSVTSSVNKLVQLDSTQSAETTISADADVSRDVAASVAAEFTQSTVIENIRGFNADVSSQASLAAAVVKTTDTTVYTEAIATELAAVAKIGDFLVTCETQATLAAESSVAYSVDTAISISINLDVAPNYITENNLILAASASVTADNERTRDFDSALASEFTQITDAIRTSVNIIALNSEFNLNGSVMRLRGVSSTLSMSAAVNADISITKDFYSDLAADTAQTTVVNSTLGADIALESNFNLNGIISHIEGADIVADSFAALTADVEAGMFGAAALDAAFTQTANNLRVRFANSSISSSSTVSALVNERVQLAASLTSTATQSSIVNVTRKGAAALAATATLSCTISHIEGADLTALSNASLTSTVRRLRGVNATVAASATMTIAATKLKRATANISAAATVTAAPTKAIILHAALTSNASVTARAGYLTNASANFVSAMTFVATVREIDIDSINQYVYVIPRETFSWRVSAENWERTIPEETNTYIVRRI